MIDKRVKARTKPDGTVEQLTSVRMFHDYTKETFGGFSYLSEDVGRTIDDPDKKSPQGIKYTALKKDPALIPALYMCNCSGCDDRILIGIKDVGHITYAIQTIKALKWSYQNNQFLCPEHSLRLT